MSGVVHQRPPSRLRPSTCPAHSRTSAEMLTSFGNRVRGRVPHSYGHIRGTLRMSTRSFPAIFARGGTSNGLVIERRHLPPVDEWPAVLASAMGSPDPYGRQLDGMGSGISSTSKICVVAPSSHPESDIDFTFVQVGVKDGALDMAGNCGNMSSAIGPLCFDEGLLSNMSQIELDSTGQHTALVRIFNTNTSKIIHSRFKVSGSPWRYCHIGDYEMDGVPGKQSKIVLSFVDPAGAKTGRA
jgi:2-methylaconitate cis-trans-isomerase PrpF